MAPRFPSLSKTPTHDLKRQKAAVLTTYNTPQKTQRTLEAHKFSGHIVSGRDVPCEALRAERFSVRGEQDL